MRKNGSRLISVKQYRMTDLFVFAIILAAAELLTHYAGRWFPGGAFFTFTLTVPIVMTVMIRWGWPSVFYSVASGLLISLVSLNTISGVQFASYAIGNAFVGLMLIPLYLIGGDKIRSRWWSTALFMFGGWLCIYLGRSVVWAIGYTVSPVSGTTAASGFIAYAVGEMLSLAMAILLAVVFRRFDGLFENQVSYLKRIDKERKDRMRYDDFGDSPVEIDDEAMNILKRDNDLYD